MFNVQVLVGSKGHFYAPWSPDLITISSKCIAAQDLHFRGAYNKSGAEGEASFLGWDASVVFLSNCCCHEVVLLRILLGRIEPSAFRPYGGVRH